MGNSIKRAKNKSECCCICGKKLDDMAKQGHHIKPKEFFGDLKNKDRNIMILCEKCHKDVTTLFSFSRKAYVTVMNKAIDKNRNPNWAMDKISLSEISYSIMLAKGQAIVAHLNNILNK